MVMQTAAERMRRMRARKAAERTAKPIILYERADWRLFIDQRTLPQKAGCEPREIGRVVLKELTDNALDAGARDVTLEGHATRCVVRDNGPGIETSRPHAGNTECFPWIIAAALACDKIASAARLDKIDRLRS